MPHYENPFLLAASPIPTDAKTFLTPKVDFAGLAGMVTRNIPPIAKAKLKTQR
jgi:hypothetical protein